MRHHSVMRYEARSSRQKGAVTDNADATCPEVDGAPHMPGVYKIPMVRMAVMPDETPECKGLKMPHTEMYVWVDTQTVRFSRNGCYELP